VRMRGKSVLIQVGIETEEADQSLIGEPHVAALAAQAGKLKPVVSVFDGRNHHRANRQRVLSGDDARD